LDGARVECLRYRFKFAETDEWARAWHTHTINVTLAPGAPAGQLGLHSMEVYDKAGNKRSYDFIETLHFRPFVRPPSAVDESAAAPAAPDESAVPAGAAVESFTWSAAQ
jgi:hypothetical protein